MNKKITSSVLAALMIAGSTSFSALAAMANGTVVIGTKAFDLAYANNPANAAEITNAVVAANGAIFVKDFEGNWIDNNTNAKVLASVIPAVTYKSATGVVTSFDAGDKDSVSTLLVESVSATNYKEVVVKFNKAVDASLANNIANYTVKVAGTDKVVSAAKVSADKMSVTLTLTNITAQQDKIDVTINKAVGLTETVTKSVTSVLDLTIPVAIKSEQVGPSAIKVTFSEPVNGATATNFKVDDGKYFINGASISQPATNVVVFELYTTLPAGTHKVSVSDIKDYANYVNVATDLTFDATIDATAPTLAKVVKATPDQVIVEFSEDIALIGAAANFYHTNTGNTATSVALVTGTTNQVKLDFSGHKLPNGTAYLYIAKDSVKDGWNNKNIEISTAIQVTVDATKPEVKEVKATDDKNILVTFTEDVNAPATHKYTLLDATGKEVTDVPTIAFTAGKTDQVKLTYAAALSGTSYTLVVETVKDLAGNQIDKISKTFAVTDTTVPTVTITGKLYSSAKIAKISFSEAMNSADLLNLGNYLVGGTYLNDTKVTASITDNGKAVLLDFSKETTITLAGGNVIAVGKMKDLAGNSVANLATNVTLVDQDVTGLLISSVNVTGTKTVVVKLNDALAAFEANDFMIKDEDGVAVTTAAVDFNNVDGKGVITFTLATALQTNATTVAGKTLAVSTDAVLANINSKNAFGVKVAADKTVSDIVDAIAPVLVTYDHDSNAATTSVANIQWATATTIELNYSENIKANTVSTLTYTVEGYDVDQVVVAGSKVTLTVSAAVTTPKANPVLTQVYNITDEANNAFVSGLNWIVRN